MNRCNALQKNRDKKIKKYENTISETQTNIDKVFKEKLMKRYRS